MINRNVVLVLGAGASVDYGLPLGAALKRSIVSTMSDTSGLPIIAARWKVNQEFISRFAAELAESALGSIDAWLEGRPEFISLGKMVICYEIGKAETLNNLIREIDKDGNPLGWYHVIWQKMKSGVTELSNLANNRISFITFNYDRSLEAFLMRAAKATFGKSEADCARVLKEIPIIHIHGQAGLLPWQNDNQNLPTRDYGRDGMPLETAKQCAGLINIIHENTAPHNLELARKELQQAEAIYFLGFGYHRENMMRLHAGLSAGPEIAGTCQWTYNKPKRIEMGGINGFGSKIELHKTTIETFLNEVAWTLHQ